jgi:hypothetical protein
MTINDILRATRTDDGPKEEPNSGLLEKVVMPVLAVAEQEFAHALNRIDFEDMTRRAERLHQDDGWDTAA